MNDFLATNPFDLYELQLFHLVAEHRNFTKAAQAAGLTQSAITRQISGMEERLGVRLFERTTRFVRLTPAGAALHARSETILNGVHEAIDALKRGSNLLPSSLRIGITRTIGLAYLPGFFHRFQAACPSVQLHVTHQSSNFIAAAVESRELDIGIITASHQISPGLEVTHRFADEFTIIAPPNFHRRHEEPISPATLPVLALDQRWLLISRTTTTGKQLHEWLHQFGVTLQPAFEADNFDLLTQLVSLGLGMSLAPHRVLALHRNAGKVRRIRLEPKFVREIAVVVREGSSKQAGVKEFIENVLF